MQKALRLNDGHAVYLGLLAKKDGARRGYLSKRSSDNTKWHPKWFALLQNMLFYFENDSSSRPAGLYLLEGCLCDRAPSPKPKDALEKQVGWEHVGGEGGRGEGAHRWRHYFTVNFNHENQKTLELRTEDAKDCDEWVAAISHASYGTLATEHEGLMQKYLHLLQIVETEKTVAKQLRQQIEDGEIETERLKSEIATLLKDHERIQANQANMPNDDDIDIKKIKKVQSFLRGWLCRRKWKTIIQDYIRSPHADSMRKRNQVVFSMLEAEAEYVQQLHILVNNFLRPLRMAASSKKPPITHDDVSSIFLNSETIMFLHQIFYQGLKARISSWPTLVLGECKQICCLPCWRLNQTRRTFSKVQGAWFPGIQRGQCKPPPLENDLPQQSQSTGWLRGTRAISLQDRERGSLSPTPPDMQWSSPLPCQVGETLLSARPASPAQLLTACLPTCLPLPTADLFDILLPMLNIYQEFVRNHQYSLQILAHCKQNRDFDKLLKHYEAKPDCEERTLETFLTYPMFQIPRYILTLHELLAHTPHEHVERNSLDYAKSKLEELSRSEGLRAALRGGGSRIKHSEELGDRADDYGRLRNPPGHQPDLRETRLPPGRGAGTPGAEGCDGSASSSAGSLIQVPMSEKGKVTRGRLGSLSLRKEGERQCFLFSKHLIICTRGSGGKLHLTKNGGVISLIDCTLVEDTESTDEDRSGQDTEHLDFKIVVEPKDTAPYTIILVASSRQEKAAWTSDISQCVDNIRCNGLMMNAFEENSKVTVPQMIKSDTSLYCDDVDIRFSKTMNSCKVLQIRYASVGRLLERLTDLRFLSIDFLNTFLHSSLELLFASSQNTKLLYGEPPKSPRANRKFSSPPPLSITKSSSPSRRRKLSLNIPIITGGKALELAALSCSSNGYASMYSSTMSPFSKTTLDINKLYVSGSYNKISDEGEAGTEKAEEALLSKTVGRASDPPGEAHWRDLPHGIIPLNCLPSSPHAEFPLFSYNNGVVMTSCRELENSRSSALSAASAFAIATAGANEGTPTKEKYRRMSLASPGFPSDQRNSDKEFVIRRAATNRVLNVLRHWVSKHAQDFETKEELKYKVISFLEEVMHDPELLTQERKAAGNIIRQVKRRSGCLTLATDGGLNARRGGGCVRTGLAPECWLPQMLPFIGLLAQGKRLISWPDFPMEERGCLGRLRLPLLTLTQDDPGDNQITLEEILQMVTSSGVPKWGHKKPVLAVGVKAEPFENHSALEIAEQLTLLDHLVFKTIPYEEFFGQGWMKMEKNERTPYILMNTKHFNDISNLIASEILRNEDMAARVSTVEKWVAVADICRCLHNYNAVLEITSAFNRSAIFRLKKTWMKVSKPTKAVIDKLQRLVSSEGRFKNLREALKNCDPPCVPYLGMYLTDLAFIEEGTPNYTEDGLVNFSKMRMISHIIREIRQFQQTAYKIEHQAKVTQYLLDQSFVMDEEGLYDASLKIEPKLPT
ncbi:Ras-specific guanine nucleotide-releasing factor 1, partial [Ophiophagus hannah]